MSTTLFILQMLGPVVLVAGISILLYREKYVAMMKDFRQFNLVYFIAGLTPMAIGLAIVLNHNIWTTPPAILVSFIGWAALLKGVIRLLFPDFVFRMVGKTSAYMTLWAVIALILGAWMTYQGYATFFL